MPQNKIIVIPEILTSQTITGAYNAESFVKRCFSNITNEHDQSSGNLGMHELRIFAPGLTIPIPNFVDIVNITFPTLNGDSYSSLDYGAHWTDLNHRIYPEVEDVIQFCINYPNTEQQYTVARAESGSGWNDTPIQGAEFGRFYIERQSLILSDLSHSSRTVPIIKQVCMYLVEAGYLRLDEHSSMTSRDARPAKKIKVTIGADPEFEYVNHDGYVVDYFPTSLFSERGRLPNQGGTEELGIDGAGNVIEFRPPYALAPSKLTANVRRIMERVKNHHLSTLGDRFAIGCHIHFGVGFNWMPPSDLIMMLDDFLGSPCYLMNGNSRQEYRDLGQCRDQSHGFEYRSLPAAVIQNPEFFRIVLKIGKMIVEKYVNGRVMEYELCNLSFCGEVYTRRVPTRLSYMRICGVTNDELTYFYKVIDEYRETKTYNKSVVACWKVENAVSHRYIAGTPPYDREDDEENDGDTEETSVPDDVTENTVNNSTIRHTINYANIILNFREQWEQDIVDDIYRRFVERAAACDELLQVIDDKRPRLLIFNGNNEGIGIELIGLRASRGNAMCGFGLPAPYLDYADISPCYQLNTGGDDTPLFRNGEFGLCRQYRMGAIKDGSPTYYQAVTSNLVQAMITRLITVIHNIPVDGQEQVAPRPNRSPERRSRLYGELHLDDRVQVMDTPEVSNYSYRIVEADIATWPTHYNATPTVSPTESEGE